MKIIKRILISAAILVLIVMATMRLKANKEKIEETTELATQTVAEFPIKITTPQMGIINENIASTGNLVADQDITVLSETQGTIVKVNKQVGDYVKVGDVIVEVDDETIAASVLVAEANYEQQKKDIERYERLVDGNALSKHDLEQAKIGLKKAEADLINARKALRDTKITAPISGIINQRMVDFGQYLAGGMQVCEIVNTSKMKIPINVTESDIFNLKKGQEVEITIPVIPGETFIGKVNTIGEKADNSMKFAVEIIMENTSGDNHLKAGLYAEVSIPVSESETIILDKKTIVGSIQNPTVFVVENGKAVKRDIVTGKSDENNVEVLSGLTLNDQVVVNGQLNLSDGNNVKIID